MSRIPISEGPRAATSLVGPAAARLFFSLRLERAAFGGPVPQATAAPEESSDAAEHWLPDISAGVSEGSEVRARRMRGPGGVDGPPF